MLIIEYDPIHGKVIPDGKVREWADEVVKMYYEEIAEDLTVLVGSVLMVDVTRMLIAKEKLDHKDVVYRFGDFDQSPDKHGMLRTWPRGFCDYLDGILDDLLFGSKASPYKG